MWFSATVRSKSLYYRALSMVIQTQLKVQRDVRAQPRCGRASDSIGVRDVCDGQSLERTVSAIVRSKSLDHRALSMARRTHHGTAQ